MFIPADQTLSRVMGSLLVVLQLSHLLLVVGSHFKKCNLSPLFWPAWNFAGSVSFLIFCTLWMALPSSDGKAGLCTAVGLMSGWYFLSEKVTYMHRLSLCNPKKLRSFVIIVVSLVTDLCAGASQLWDVEVGSDSDTIFCHYVLSNVTTFIWMATTVINCWMLVEGFLVWYSIRKMIGVKSRSRSTTFYLMFVSFTSTMVNLATQMLTWVLRLPDLLTLVVICIDLVLSLALSIIVFRAIYVSRKNEARRLRLKQQRPVTLSHMQSTASL